MKVCELFVTVMVAIIIVYATSTLISFEEIYANWGYPGIIFLSAMLGVFVYIFKNIFFD